MVSKVSVQGQLAPKQKQKGWIDEGSCIIHGAQEPVSQGRALQNKEPDTSSAEVAQL